MHDINMFSPQKRAYNLHITKWTLFKQGKGSELTLPQDQAHFTDVYLAERRTTLLKSHSVYGRQPLQGLSNYDALQL